MALTIKKDANADLEHLSLRVLTVSLDNSYPTGGYALAASDFNFTTLYAVLVSSRAGYQLTWDAANSKLMVFYVTSATTSPLTQVPNATNLSSVTGVTIVGLGA